jgi:hypothetical protein
MNARPLPRVVLGIVATSSILVAVFAVGVTNGDGPGTSAPLRAERVQASGTGDHYGYIDQSNGNWFRAELDPSAEDAGEFQFAAWGLGVFWSENPATVSRDSAGVSHVSFSGAGQFNRGATWDRSVGGVEAQFSDVYEDVSFQFVATVQPDFQTVSGTLTFAGDIYPVTYQAPPHNADAPLQSAMNAFVSRDWHAFYLASDSSFLAAKSESVFTAEMIGAEATEGVVVNWAKLGLLEYHGEPGVGPHVALEWLTIDISLGGTVIRYPSRVEMIEDMGQWKMWTLDPPIPAITVSPANMNGWGFVQETATATGSLVSGPGTPPSGSGSAKIALGSTGGGLYGTVAFAGTRLDAIDAINYSTYQPTGNPGTVQTISLQFDMDYDLTDSNTAWQGRLVFEPYFTNTVTKGSWQTWDPLAGKWWATGNPGKTKCPQATPCTWAKVLQEFPNAGLRVSMGGLEFKAGSGWPASWQGNVDAFVIVVGDEAKAFDFEP